MKIVFWNTTNHPRSLNKTAKGHSSELTIENYEAIDDLNGYVIMQPITDIWNYCAITHNVGYPTPTLNPDGSSVQVQDALVKYYFITSKEYLTGGKVKINLHEDVLMTYKDAIRELPAIIGRTQSGYINANLPGDLPTEAYHTTDIYYPYYVEPGTQTVVTGKEMKYNKNKLILVTSGGVSNA